ncbi:hypothetical protein MKZ38_002990 [Zalerion maritima]|uniref:Uncharacterized protein n=1 Tax=Zalerion maritima TaxID=339359 RepID=A0AAD5RND1_9PEZI|nr:hypothetical protein MKZ38_002990 [Zalerion maritima]
MARQMASGPPLPYRLQYSSPPVNMQQAPQPPPRAQQPPPPSHPGRNGLPPPYTPPESLFSSGTVIMGRQNHGMQVPPRAAHSHSTASDDNLLWDRTHPREDRFT